MFVTSAFGCLILVSLTITTAEAIGCYTCTNVSSVSQCRQTTACGSPSEKCRIEYTATLNRKLFTLGCSDATLCPKSSPGLIGRSAARESCNGCCTTDNCNRQLCQAHDPSCTDTADFDCPTIGATTNYCDDLHGARTYCKNFCGLCSLRDGSWSVWSQWSDCTVSCGNGTQSRVRACSNPNPTDGGDNCVGTANDVQTCSQKHCPVHGSWSTWSSWGICSTSCDIGMRRRDRSCNNPFPSADGSFCFGDARDDLVCVMAACRDGGWSAWSSWGVCSRSCGDGINSRSRTCDNPTPSIIGKHCAGDSSQTQSCHLRNCQVLDGGWSAWSSWGVCSRSCGDGIHSRSRTCANPTPSATGRYCVGDSLQPQSCKVRHCPVKVSAFTVTHPTGHGTPLTFSSVVFNEGGNFNANAGKFTCTIPGVYFFALSLIKVRSSDDSINDRVIASIRLNGSNKVSTVTDPDDGDADIGSYGASASVTLRLRKGDEVDISSTFPSTHLESDSMFSGFLIQPDEN